MIDDDYLPHYEDEGEEAVAPAMPPIPWNWNDLRREAQSHAVERIHSSWVTRRPGLLGMSCIGTGKTVVSMTALRTSPIPWKRALVIAPPQVARTTWPDEPANWIHLKDFFRVANTVGLSPKKRLSICLDQQFNMVTLSCDSVKWFFETFPPGKIPFDVLIIDESDKFKSPKTSRYKILKRRILEFKLRILQTGSPADEHLLELYTQGHLASPGIWARSYSQFEAKYFYPENRFDQYSKLVPHDGAEEQIYSTLEPITFRVAREDMGDRPTRQVVVERLTFGDDAAGKKLAKAYKQMEREFLFEVSEEEKIPIGHAGALHQKLKQFADGFVYGEIDETGARPVHEQHNIKIDRCKDLIERLNADGEQVLIAYRFKTTPERLGVPYLGGGVSMKQREKLIKEFQSGKLRALAIHPASAGHGLNLQLGGCRYLILFGMNESRRLYNQFCGRVDRTGQRRQVYEIRLVMGGTVDMDVYHALESKGIGAKTVLDAMRARVGV